VTRTAHERPAYVAQQFEDFEQQTHSATLGMWTFLSTEILFFGVLFVSYMVCRTRWPDAFRQGSRDLILWIGVVNTAVLLTSSLFMALAVRAAGLGNQRGLITFLSLTLLFGLMFLGFKGYEYSLDVREQLVPNYNFSTLSPAEAAKPPARRQLRPAKECLFMVFYFIMTGFHALHMLAGVGVLTVLLIMSARGRFTAECHNPIEIAGLYWHFVDVVWVFILPALYLLRNG